MIEHLMAGEQPLPVNAWGLAGVALLSIPATLAAWATWRSRHKLGDVQATADAINHQVTNSHDTNLRDDISFMMRELWLIRDNQGNFARELVDMRSDIRRLYIRTEDDHGSPA